VLQEFKINTRGRVRAKYDLGLRGFTTGVLLLKKVYILDLE